MAPYLLCAPGLGLDATKLMRSQGPEFIWLRTSGRFGFLLSQTGDGDRHYNRDHHQPEDREFFVCYNQENEETSELAHPGTPMATRASTVTAKQLFNMPDDGNRYELIRGELRMMPPAGGRHGRVAHNLGLVLGTHVRQAELGAVYAAETGFSATLDAGDVIPGWRFSVGELFK